MSKFFSEPLLIYFYLKDSDFEAVSISPSSDGKRTFELQIWQDNNGNLDDIYSWKISVEAEDILVRAFQYVCIVAKAIHNGKLQRFINKMNMVNG